MRSKAPLDTIFWDLSSCQMWKGFALCPCRPLVHQASGTKHLHLCQSRWHRGQGCLVQGVSLQCSHTRSHTLPSPRTRKRPSRPLTPFSLQTQGFYHPPGPTRLQKAKGMLPFVALPCGLPLLRCTYRAAAGTWHVLQMDCTAVGIWQAAGCLCTSY